MEKCKLQWMPALSPLDIRYIFLRIITNNCLRKVPAYSRRRKVSGWWNIQTQRDSTRYRPRSHPTGDPSSSFYIHNHYSSHTCTANPSVSSISVIHYIMASTPGFYSIFLMKLFLLYNFLFFLIITGSQITSNARVTQQIQKGNVCATCMQDAGV